MRSQVKYETPDPVARSIERHHRRQWYLHHGRWKAAFRRHRRQAMKEYLRRTGIPLPDRRGIVRCYADIIPPGVSFLAKKTYGDSQTAKDTSLPTPDNPSNNPQSNKTRS